MNKLVDGIVSGSIKAIARGISIVENNTTDKTHILKEIYKHTGKATIIGVTGPPGVGKSSLINVLIKEYRTQNKKVGILAVDPTSPFTGGSLLGDRLRMQSHSIDDAVFIRSLATRGYLGGISPAVYEAIRVLEAGGFDPIIIETVGVGQSEVEIAEVSDIVLLVLAPGYGDEIQIIKAGIIEIGDVYIINKCEQPGAEKLKSTIEYYIDTTSSDSTKYKKVLTTSAINGTGITELIKEVDKIISVFRTSGILENRRRIRIKRELTRILNARIIETVKQVFNEDKLNTSIDKILKREQDPYTVAECIFRKIIGKKGDKT